MTLPATGSISMAAVRAEIATGGPVSLGADAVRALAGVPAGAISLADLHGKSGAATASMTAVASDDIASGPTTGVAFTAYAHPSVVESGGTPPYSRNWTIATQTDSGFTLTGADQATCTVTHTIGKYGYVGQCTLTCVSSDSKGQQVVNQGIVAGFDYQQDIYR